VTRLERDPTWTSKREPSRLSPLARERDAMQTTLATDKMRAEVADGIGTMTIHNPERRNAISLEMWQAIETILASFAADPAVRVVIVRGGEKAFASGADISQFETQRNNAEQAEAYARVSAAGARALASFEKPLLAMIEGYCLGGGMRFALAADIRIASDDARFGIPAARLGLGYGYPALRALTDLIGPAHATEMLLTARHYTAAEAEKIGLVHRVVPAEALLAATRMLAHTIAGHAPLTVRAVKRTMREVAKDPADRDLALCERLVQECFDSRDYAEGRRAFLEKRRPVFEGR
jgi:enoyl-CoA hydratase/carnithine racemase